MNEKRKEVISYAMFKNKISKLQLSTLMSLSYPTMLSKLSNPGTLKINEADKLCSILNIELTEFLTNNK